jgi:hypothetical protein
MKPLALLSAIFFSPTKEDPFGRALASAPTKTAPVESA